MKALSLIGLSSVFLTSNVSTMTERGVRIELEFRNVAEMNPMYQYENTIFVEIHECNGYSKVCSPSAKMRDDFATSTNASKPVSKERIADHRIGGGLFSTTTGPQSAIQ